MERLIQFLDDLDDLLAPAIAFPSAEEWLRGLAVLALVASIVLTTASWTLAALLAPPALPVARFLHERLRRPAPPHFQIRPVARFESEI